MTRTNWIFTALACTAVALAPAMEHDGERPMADDATTTTTDPLPESSVSTGTTTPTPELDDSASANETDADATPNGSSAGSTSANEIATGTAEPVPEGKDPAMANARENEAAADRPIDDESEAVQAGEPGLNRETHGDPASVNERDHDSTVDEGAHAK
ncbi:MAG: hypothetical protein H0X45_11830 [Planctomycetes bacterium]|nr:hypothetical protein [Planctomycetota bacterium]